jgi:hypothetical protein
MLKCPNPECFNFSSFEVDNISIKGTRPGAYLAVKCSECGCIIGIIDSDNIPSELVKLKEDIQRLESKINAIVNE